MAGVTGADVGKAERLLKEVGSFRGRWPGGYFEGDPFDPVGRSSFDDLGYLSVLYAVYRYCIRPRVKGDMAVVEIGPGRGAWTRTLLTAREVWALDAASAEETGFWRLVGGEFKDRVRYVQVSDFSCRDLPDDHFDFLFSFGVFCHITWEGQQEYYRNLLPKMKRGAEAFVSFADFDKYNGALRIAGQLRTRPLRGNPVAASLVSAARYVRNALRHRRTTWPAVELEKGKPNAVGFHHAGVRETARYLESVGWEVVEPDLELTVRDPIVHFRKP